jgi:hypothetical protein
MKILKKIIFFSFLLFWVSAYSQNEMLIGKWVICATSCNGTEVNFNECMFVEFMVDNKFILNYKRNPKVLKWSFNNSILQITSSEKKATSFPFEKKYYVIKSVKDDEIIIAEQDNLDCVIFLDKIK